MILPPIAFRRDYHWRELSPKEGASRWRFQYLTEVPHRLDRDLGQHVQLCDAAGKPWVIIDGRWWLTQPGYRWNGCSPKRHIPLLGWVGTPDVPGDRHGYEGNLIASGWHDQARQFAKTKFVSSHYTIQDLDRGFHQILRMLSYPHANLFYKAVAIAAPFWPQKDEGQHSRIVQ
jgi:hypothetical protein